MTKAFPLLALAIIVVAVAIAVSGNSPQSLAQATAIAQAAADASAARAIERDTAQRAQAGVVAGKVLGAVGVGIGALVLAIGCAFAVVAVVNKLATSVYPNAAGMYPVIVKRSWNGITIVHDPNRALGPTTIYTTPSLVHLMANVLGAPQLDAGAQFPQPGSEATMAQLASQAQATAALGAVTRQPLIGEPRKVDDRLIRAVAGAHLSLPPVTAIAPAEWVEATGRFELEGGDASA